MQQQQQQQQAAGQPPNAQQPFSQLQTGLL